MTYSSSNYERPIPKFDGVCLTFSSLFFMIPGVYGFLNNVYSLGILSAATTAVSVNYWRHAVPGWRKEMDLFFAKFSFLIYFLVGVYNIRNRFILQIGWPNTVMIILCYAMSNHLWSVASYSWLYFHMAFHLFVALGQLIVIYGSFVLL